MRTVAMLGVIGVLLVSAGCSSSVSTVKATRELNETSAAELIKDQLAKQSFRVAVDDVSQLFAKTSVDYRGLNEETGRQADLKRLLDKGFVVQKAESVSYPLVSGSFKMDAYGQVMEWRLQMVPNSNTLIGERLLGGAPMDRGVRLTLEPDGQIREGQRYLFRYAEQGPAASLDSASTGAAAYRLTGSASGKRVDVKMYTYSWSSDLEKQLLHTQNGTYVAVGNYQVRGVSGLRLVTETEAVAKFMWNASLDDLGKLFFPTQPPSGVSEAAFGKKPDGTWFVDRLEIGK